MDTKNFLKSKTLIGVVMSVLPALLPAVGISFGPDDMSLVSDSIDKIIQAVGAVMAIYGRFVAKKSLTAA